MQLTFYDEPVFGCLLTDKMGSVMFKLLQEKLGRMEQYE